MTTMHGPRPYPYPRPIPPPPIPLELQDPISCYKCHSPTLPLPALDSTQISAAESYYRQVLTSTWRTQIDSVEAHQLANELEQQGLLERWVEHWLEQGGGDPTLVGDKVTLEQQREGLKEAVRIVTSKEPMELRMERVLKRTMESVLVRMASLGYGTYCFHDLLQSSPHATVPTYTPTPPLPTTSAASFSLGILRSTAANRLPSFKTRLREQRLTPDDLATLLTEAYPLWRALLIECCKREHHKSMYDVQLMMVGGFSLKLLELAWRELFIDRSRGRTVESSKRVGFARVVKWCDMGGVRIALWDKGEKERMDKERKREVERLVLEEQARKEREVKDKEERKKRERTERRRKRDQDRYEEVLGRIVAIDKERRALLEESVLLETERNALETKLNPNTATSPTAATSRPSTPAVADSVEPSASSTDPAPVADAPPIADSSSAPPATAAADSSSPPAPTPSEADEAIARAEAELLKAEERVKIAHMIESVFQRMVDNPASSAAEAAAGGGGAQGKGKKGGKGGKNVGPVVKPFVPPPVPKPTLPTTVVKSAPAATPAPAPAVVAALETTKVDTSASNPTPVPAAAAVDSTSRTMTSPEVNGTSSPTPSVAPERLPSPSPTSAASPPPPAAVVAESSSTTSTTTLDVPPAAPVAVAPLPPAAPPLSSWAQRVSRAHSTWIPPSGPAQRRTAIRRMNSDGTTVVEEPIVSSASGGEARAGLELGVEEAESPAGGAGGEGREFVQGNVRMMLREWRMREEVHPFFKRAPRFEAALEKGKGKAPILECTCDFESRSSSPAPRRSRKTGRRLKASSRSASVDPRPRDELLQPAAASAPAPAAAAATKNALTPSTSTTASTSGITFEQLTLPHVCPVDVHTPDPHAPDDWVQPPTINADVSANLAQCFLAAYSAALVEINGQQLVQLFQSATKDCLGEVWGLGGSARAYVEGREEERRAVESVVGEIVCVTAKKDYHDRVAKLALRVALPKVVKEVWKSLRASLTRETRDTQPPCLCLIEAQSWILHDFLNRHHVLPTPATSLLPYYDTESTLAVHGCYSRLVATRSSPPLSAEQQQAQVRHMLEAHEKAFDAFQLRAVKVVPADFASAKHVVKLLTAQGGAAIWRMATKQMAALDALEADTFSPLNAWETVVEDVGVRAEEQVFRKENDTLQNKIIFDDVTAPWGSLTGLNTGHPTDPEACVFDLTVATSVRPDLPRPYLARAIARLKIDRPWHNSEILYDASMALALSPPLSPAETAVAYRVRAAAYSKQCRLKEAYQDFRRDTESKASVTATALLRNSLPGARITLPGFLRPPKSRTRSGKTVCHPGRCCMPPAAPNDLALLKPLDKPILEAFLAAVRYEAHLAYQREVHRVLTESVFGSLLFDESDLERHAPSTMAQLPASKHPRFWYEGVEAYFDHTAVKVFPQELQKSMQSWLSTDWYQEHMAETLERAAKRFAEDWLYPGDDKQCLCTLNGNPETFTRLETARKTYDALCDAVQRPSSIVAADCASLHRDVQEEIAEGTRTSDFWSKGGWAEPLDRAAALGFVRLSQVLAEEEKAGRLNWIEQYDGVVKVLRHVGGVLIYHSVASSPMLDHEGRRRIGDVDDFAAWVSVALEQRELNAESAVLLEDMGDEFFNAEDGERALRCYSQAIAVHRTPKSLMQRVQLVQKLAKAVDQQERIDRAQLIVRDCSQALALQPVNPAALAARATALFTLGFHYYYDACSDLFALHHIAPDHETILLLAHQLDDLAGHTQEAGLLDGAHSPIPPLYNRLRTTLTSVHPFKTSRPTPLVKSAELPSDVEGAVEDAGVDTNAGPPTTLTNSEPLATNGQLTTTSRRGDLPSLTEAANSAVVRHGNEAWRGDSTRAIAQPISYYTDPRCACPPIRCSGAVPVVENLDKLDELLLQIFLMSHKIELAERRPLSFASIRDTLLRQYILTPGWEKGNVDSLSQRALMETLSNDLLSSGYENGTARADRGLESWLNATLLAIKSLPIHRGTASSRDCCVCLLSGNMEHVRVVHSVLARKVEQLSDDPITLPRPDLAGLLSYCRTQIKLGTLVARGGIWRSAPKWRFQVEKLAGVFEDVFEQVVRKFNYRAFEDDYPQIAKLVGGLATFEAAHRLLLHPDPPEPGSTKRPPLAVEDVLGWAAFVSANAPYEGDGDLSKLGDVKTIGLATAKVDEATKLFRDAKYLEAIRAYSIAAIWACDRSGKETPGAERKYLRDEARRTLKSGIYAQLSYLRTLFPSNRQWMSAVADATLAIACSQKAELPAALDLRSTALHGIRHYKYALADLEDAARLDPVKGLGWEDRLSEMRRLVPAANRITSRFATRLDAAGPISFDFQELNAPRSACPRPGCSGKSCSGEDAHVVKAKDAVAHFTNGTANGTNGHRQDAVEGAHMGDASESDSGKNDDWGSESDDAHPLANYVLCPDSRLACPPHRCSGVKSTESNIARLDSLLLDLFVASHTHEYPATRRASFVTRREGWVREFILNPEMIQSLGTLDPAALRSQAKEHVQSRFSMLASPRGRALEGWRFWSDASALALSMLEPSGRGDPATSKSCICELTSNIDRVQAALDVLLLKARAQGSKPLSKLPSYDIPLMIAYVRDLVNRGGIPKLGAFANEATWTIKIAELAEIYSAAFDRSFAKLDDHAYSSAFPKIARYLGGVATYSAARRLSSRPEMFEYTQGDDVFGWTAFAAEYADTYLAQGELSDIPAEKRMALAEEQDRKAQKSGGKETLAILAFSIKSIWLGHLSYPLRDDDGARDDLFCTYAAVAKLRVRLLTTEQLEEAVTDFTAALGYLNSATIRLNRAEALVLIGNYDELAAKDVLEARSVGNFSGRELPAWEASLAQRLSDRGYSELSDVHRLSTDGARFTSTTNNGFVDIVDVPKTFEPAESSLQDVVESAVAAIDQSLSATPIHDSSSSPSTSLPDPRLACSPDRHDVGIDPSPANVDQVDIFLLDIFLQIHQQMLHKLHPGRLAETRELFLQDFIRRRSGWEKTDVEISPVMRESMREGIKVALGEMFSSSVLAGFGLEAVVHSLGAMSKLISSHYASAGVTPCICTLTKAIPFLQKTLAELKQVTAKLPRSTPPPPTDLTAIQAHCRAQIKTNALSGGIWRSNPVWRKKISSLVPVFDQVFIEVVENDWEGAEAAKRGEYEAVARMVGGIAIWDRALRVEQEMTLGGWKIEESGAGNGGREVEAVAPYMCFVGTSGASTKNAIEGESEAAKRARWAKVKDERIRLGNVELANNEPKRALREFGVASLFVPDDPSIYVLMARARLAMNDKAQCHEVIADCTLGLARCSVPPPSLPATLSERERATSAAATSLPAIAPASSKSPAPPATDPTAYTRADLLLLRAKALVAVERFGLALYDLEALSSSLRREHTAEADDMIKRIKEWIAQEQDGLERLREEAADQCCGCGAHSHDEESGEEEGVEGEGERRIVEVE